MRAAGPVSLLIIALACMPLGACKLVRRSELNKTGEAAAAANTPEAKVAGIWQSRVVPYLEKKAGAFAEVQALAAEDTEAAGQKYGYREKGGTAPWTMIVRLEGKIIAANTESRAGTIDVDTTGAGKPDVRVQIGPVMRGTAIRDSLDFVSFDDFTNQIDFAQFGKAFNTTIEASVTSKLPRRALVGRTVKILGAYPLGPAGDLPLLTPAEIKVSGAP